MFEAWITFVADAYGAAEVGFIPGAPDALLPTLILLTGVLVLIGLPILLLEIIVMWRRRALNWRRGSGMLTSLLCLVPAAVTDTLFAGALLILFYGVASLAPWTIETTWWTALFCFVLVDLAYYVEHRLAHRINVAWALYHSVHHSADHFDQTIGARLSAFDFFFTPLVYLPLVFAGFHPILVLTCFGLNLAWQQWIHTELIGRLPWLDGWLNTPSNHRVHHGRNPQYVDKNYGGVLIVWDHLFGTYEPEGEPVDYGLVEPLVSRNPIAVHFHVFGKLVRALAAARSLRSALRILFAPPERAMPSQRQSASASALPS